MMTENEYLESRLLKFSKTAIRGHKQARDALLTLFSQRELVTLINPSRDKLDAQDIHGRCFDDLPPKFQQDVELVQFKVLSQSPTKKFFGKPINGLLLSFVLQQTVE